MCGTNYYLDKFFSHGSLSIFLGLNKNRFTFDLSPCLEKNQCSKTYPIQIGLSHVLIDYRTVLDYSIELCLDS